MELRQLEYFVAVVEEGTFTQAADRCHVAQPGVSAQIRRLERELGEELLDRSGRRVRTTAAGAAVLSHARAALAEVAAVRGAVDELTGVVRGRVSVGLLTSVPTAFPGALARFHRQHPDVDIQLRELTNDDLIGGLRDGRLDVAFIALAGGCPPGIEADVILDEALVAVVAHDDPWAKRRSVALRALADRKLMCLPAGSGLRAILDRAFTAAGLHLQVEFEAGDPGVLADLAAEGLGVAIVPESLAAGRRRQLHTLRITKPALRGQVALAWRAPGPTGAAARALIAHVTAALPSSGDASRN